MTALFIFVNTAMLALNLCFIERGSVFASEQSGVSWINVMASVALAFSIGFMVRGELDR